MSSNFDAGVRNHRRNGRLAGGILFASALAAAGAFGIMPSRADEMASLDHARQVTPPTFQGPTTPAKAPKGIKVGIVVCNAAFRGCTAPADAATEAAKKLGWTVTLYDGAADQQKANAGILDAVSAGSDVILTTSLDPNLIQLGLSAAKRAGIPVISGSNGTDTPNPIVRPKGENVTYLLDVTMDLQSLGEHVAEWIIADSGGKANVAVYTDEEYPSVVAAVNGVLAGLKRCSGCTVSPLQKFAAPQVPTTLGQQTVSYLRTHPDVNYIYGAYDPAAAFQVNAIAQAGLADRVKLVSIVGAAQNLDFIRHGRVEAATGAFDNTYMGYAMIDQAIRALNKQPLIEPHGEGDPFQVLDKTNLPPPGTEWSAHYDFKSAFLKLWQ